MGKKIEKRSIFLCLVARKSDLTLHSGKKICYQIVSHKLRVAILEQKVELVSLAPMLEMKAMKQWWEFYPIWHNFHKHNEARILAE